MTDLKRAGESVVVQPTQRPWFVGAMNDCVYVLDRAPRPVPVDDAPCGGDPDTRVIAKLDYLLAEVNAEFIVRACNSHDDLLAALKDARGWVDAFGAIAEFGGGPVHPGIAQSLARIDSAIARAEGR